MNKKTNFQFQNSKNFSILIIRLSSIGDIVLSTHLIRNLRNKYPTAKIDFLTFKEYSEILNFNFRLNNLYYVEKSQLKNNIFEINSQNKNTIELNGYSFIIDLQKNKYSKKIISNYSGKIYSINKQRLHKLSLVYLKKPLIKNFSVPLNYFDTIKELEIEDDGLGLEFWMESESEFPINKSNLSSLNTICIAPGAAHGTKQYPKEKFVELINLLFEKFKCNFILVGGKNEENIGNFLQSGINPKIKLENYIGKKTIQETAFEINKSDLFIGNDTGLMHIASGRQIPIIVIYGSSVKELGFAPFRVPHKIIEKEIWCRPCSHIGRRSCPLVHFKCMRLIQNSEIIEVINDLLIR